MELPSIHFLGINLISLISCYYLIYIKNISNYNISTVNFFYGILLVTSIISTFGITKQAENNKLEIPNILYKFINYFIITNFILFIFFIVNIDISILERNNQYLTLSDVKKLGIQSNILILFHRSLTINGIACMFFYVLLNSTNRYHIVKYISLSIGFFCLLFQLSNNSRSAGLICAGYLLGTVVTHKSGWLKVFKISIMAILIIYSYSAVLAGRNKIHQGFSEIFSNLHDSNLNELLKEGFILENLFGGAWIFYIGQNMGGNYPDTYKILSFSPTPSSIDNFDKYLKFQHRINVFVPYSSNLEVYMFGIQYIVIYFLIIYITLRFLNLMVSRNRNIGYILCMPAYLFFIANQQYPLRNYFRFFLLSGVMCFLYLTLFKKKQKLIRLNKANSSIKPTIKQ
ncbi:hypothetical protein GCM10028809_34190 [Spirosoma gilvum]